jgi:plasmid stabilization system protein ParE
MSRGPISAAGASWRGGAKSGPASPTLVLEEFEHVVELLAKTPGLGRQDEPRPDVRRILLSRSQYHVYDVIDRPRRVIRVVSLWHTARSKPPLIGR